MTDLKKSRTARERRARNRRADPGNGPETNLNLVLNLVLARAQHVVSRAGNAEQQAREEHVVQNRDRAAREQLTSAESRLLQFFGVNHRF